MGRPKGQNRNACNGIRPDVYVYDDLEDLKRRYTPEQIQKMWNEWFPKTWNECFPKILEIKGKTIITQLEEINNITFENMLQAELDYFLEKITKKEYRKTLKNYLKNHKINRSINN
jgi:hypothetical protein